jgi:phage-related protein
MTIVRQLCVVSTVNLLKCITNMKLIVWIWKRIESSISIAFNKKLNTIYNCITQMSSLYKKSVVLNIYRLGLSISDYVGTDMVY